MPMWPFGRKGRGSRAAKVKEARATSVADRQRPVAALPATRTSSDAPRRMPSQRSTRRRRRSSRSTTTSLRDVEKNSPTVALTADPSAFAKESSAFGPLPPGRRSSIEDITALPHQKRLEQSPHLRPVTLEHGIPYNFQATSHSSLPTARDRGKLQRPQSLRKSVPVDTALIRRKSSKRRRENDHLREEEIRAMSLPLPQKRPAGSSGGLLRRDSKKVKGALNHRFERPTSNVSLPVEDSIHSSMSGNSETRAFRVSTLDMFSPRPTIRYSVGSQYYYGSGTGGGSSSSPTGYQARNDVRRDRRLTASRDGDHHTTNHQRKHSRIDDLADTLDAGALREILDRDKRRREKKRKQEDERLRRRLERRAEKQKAAEAAAAVSGTPATPNTEATGAIGLGIEREALSTPTPMDDVRPSTPQPSQRLETAGLAPKAELNSQLPTPLDSPIEEPVVSDAQAVRYSRGSVSSPVHTRGPSNVSEMPELLSEKIAQETAVPSVEPVQDPSASGSLHPVETTETTATSKKGSSRRRSSEGRRMSVFASIFRRSKRKSQDQGVNTPSEVSFSNTSRESMSRQPIPAHLVAAGPRAQPVQIKRPSSVPRRTRSKFREDLPEFPLSPPDSRVQSPEVPALNTAAVRRSSQALRAQINDTQTGDRSDSPVSPGVPATGIMSQSLASVDSEGSWLSGKPMKRRSNKSQQMRNSVASSTAVKRNEEFSASYEELGIPDDEYFRRLTPSPDERRRSAHSADMLTKRASSTAMAVLDTNAGSDDEQNQTTSSHRSDEEEVVHTVGRQPTIVHRQARVKSREGLLIDGEKATLQGTPAIADSADPDSPTSETEPVTPVTLQRARSVDLGKRHARHLSAGSAKLLDIHKRSSTASQSNNKPVEQE